MSENRFLNARFKTGEIENNYKIVTKIKEIENFHKVFKKFKESLK